MTSDVLEFRKWIRAFGTTYNLNAVIHSLKVEPSLVRRVLWICADAVNFVSGTDIWSVNGYVRLLRNNQEIGRFLIRRSNAGGISTDVTQEFRWLEVGPTTQPGMVINDGIGNPNNVTVYPYTFKAAIDQVEMFVENMKYLGGGPAAITIGTGIRCLSTPF